MFTLDRERLKISDTVNGMDLWSYRHDNGYIQYFLDDDDLGVDFFIDILNNGSNALYKAYSLLDKGYINNKGEPEIVLTFGEAQTFIDDGVLPSADQLTANEQLRGRLYGI